jgi:hypothetical protein
MITEAIYFLNELDILEAHLEQHRPWGFRTVIVECPVTISGIKKPLFYHDNRKRFERFDLEHVVLPTELFPLIHGPVDTQYNQMRANDWQKRKWMHGNFDPKNPFIWHSDTDEIVAVKPEMPEGMEYGSFRLHQYMTHVNRRVSLSPTCWRVAHRDIPAKDLGAVKTFKRARSLGGGWHFTNCPSTPEEIRLKAQCRPYLFDAEHPDLVPGVEHFKAHWGEAWNYMASRPFEEGKHWLVEPDELPVWMAANLDKFPVAVKT